MSPAAKILHEHNYARCNEEPQDDEDLTEDAQDEEPDRSELQQKLRQKIKSLPQQLRRSKKKITEHERSHFTFTRKIGHKHRTGRSIIPLPNQTLLRKWSSSVNCEPGFFKEVFTALASKVSRDAIKKDCCLIIDAMAIRKQTIWDTKKDCYAGFADYGQGGPILDDPETLASEAHVFLLVEARSHWKCPIGNFLTDKISSTYQAQLINMALEMAAEAGLKVWSITADGTSVNLSNFRKLGCQFGTTYDTIDPKFKHPTTGEDVFVVTDPCHMLKLARNAFAHLGTIIDNEGEKNTVAEFSATVPPSRTEGIEDGQQVITQPHQIRKAQNECSASSSDVKLFSG
ncbi:THAP domain-containing 9 [Paramuricea clavata]|uniref:THAP domain-containing 9, partial n=1 Tax=Paramuricea clavata TaxID=317549 RepID=A0A7D9IAH3_PARCT|nr:THAP domain-containing 9 [Paramuricea clavata]